MVPHIVTWHTNERSTQRKSKSYSISILYSKVKWVVLCYVNLSENACGVEKWEPSMILSLNLCFGSIKFSLAFIQAKVESTQQIKLFLWLIKKASVCKALQFTKAKLCCAVANLMSQNVLYKRYEVCHSKDERMADIWRTMAKSNHLIRYHWRRNDNADY